MDETVYRGSDGEYYGDADIWERFEAEDWTPCCWDVESGCEWVGARDGELLALEPVSRSDVPSEIDLERVAEGLSVSSD